jgi:uncharacterized membrane protein YczE
MNTRDWLNQLICLIKLIKMEVGSILMYDSQHFAIKAYVGFLAREHSVVLATSVYRCDWRMMRNLLSQVVKFFSPHFKRLSK